MLLPAAVPLPIHVRAAHSGGAAVRFEILGDLRVLRDSTPVDLGPAKQRAVLAVLLLHAGRPVPTHQIVDAVWGDEPPENGANVVQKYVAGLRRVLDPSRAPRTPGELLALTGSGYVLQIAGHTLDADEFTAAVAGGSFRAGLALWRGEALAGLTGPVFEAARVRLTEAKATAWETWVETELSQGNDAALVPELTRLIGEFPLREALRAQLMIALHRSGRQAEALAAFREARAYLLDEFGIEPGERLQETHRRVLRGDSFAPAARPLPSAVSSSTAAPEGASESGASSGVAPARIPAQPGPEARVSMNTESGPVASSPGPGWPATGSGGPGWPASQPGASESGWSPPQAGAGWSSQVTGSDAPGSMWPGGSNQPGYPGGLPEFLARPSGGAASRPRFPYLEVLFAAGLPLVTLSLGSWIYFVVAAARQRRRWLFVAAAVYALMIVVAIVFMTIDPSPIDSGDTSSAEAVGISTFLATMFLSAVHGTAIAVQGGSATRGWALREQSRLFASVDPGRALQIGIGRPEVPRAFDDGGLVDINHVAAPVLSRHARVSAQEAERIVASRHQHGLFRRPDELVQRGLLSAKAFRRVAPGLIAVAPAASAHVLPAQA
jgi:DNA-binding SARP family transcriptional activator